jgi:hypothetical protein
VPWRFSDAGFSARGKVRVAGVRETCTIAVVKVSGNRLVHYGGHCGAVNSGVDVPAEERAHFPNNTRQIVIVYQGAGGSTVKDGMTVYVDLRSNFALPNLSRVCYA